MKTISSAICMLILFCAAAYAAPDPIIDVHLHAQPVASYGPPGQKMCMEQLKHTPPVDAGRENINEALARAYAEFDCDRLMVSSPDDETLMRDTLAIMKKRNVRGIISGPPEITAVWKAAAPDHIIRARQFNLARDAGVSPQDLAAAFKGGEFEVLAEVTNQYAGHAPNSPAFDAYWAMAEENDIPVGIHIGGMPPGAAYWGGGARINISNALLLEDIVIRHPKLRVYIMHAGNPMIENTIALMQQYPQVYAETGVLQTIMTTEGYETLLKQFIDAGLGKRLMYGTDQMVWPSMIDHSLDLVEKTKVMTREEKRDFLYNNAVRFFRLAE